MKCNEFWAKLSGLQLKWMFVRRQNGKIRSGNHCPITAVAEEVLGEHFDSSISTEVHKAGKKLGLPHEFIMRVMYSSDNMISSDHGTNVTRGKILKATGLK